MKTTFLSLCFMLCSVVSAYAQKFGYVDADFILSQMDEYNQALQDVQEAADRWKTDIAEKNVELEEMRSKYEAEEILLTEEMKEERLKEIEDFAKEIQDQQNQIFGYQGLFFSRQQELMKPPQEELYEAVQTVARKNKLQVIFTNSEGLTILYAEPRHDYTEEVLKELGLLEEEQENPEVTPSGN